MSAENRAAGSDAAAGGPSAASAAAGADGVNATGATPATVPAAAPGPPLHAPSSLFTALGMETWAAAGLASLCHRRPAADRQPDEAAASLRAARPRPPPLAPAHFFDFAAGCLPVPLPGPQRAGPEAEAYAFPVVDVGPAPGPEAAGPAAADLARLLASCPWTLATGAGTLSYTPSPPSSQTTSPGPFFPPGSPLCGLAEAPAHAYGFDAADRPEPPSACTSPGPLRPLPRVGSRGRLARGPAEPSAPNLPPRPPVLGAVARAVLLATPVPAPPAAPEPPPAPGLPGACPPGPSPPGHRTPPSSRASSPGPRSPVSGPRSEPAHAKEQEGAEPAPPLAYSDGTLWTREEALRRYREKRKHRKWGYKILYDVRRNAAARRIRIGGRFASAAEEKAARERMAAEAGGGGATGAERQ